MARDRGRSWTAVSGGGATVWHGGQKAHGGQRVGRSYGL